MEKLDVSFANRYLGALEQWQKNIPLPVHGRSRWTDERSSILVLQHLLLGVNAHINLDLAIATVETIRATNQQLPEIRKIMTRSMRSSGR